MADTAITSAGVIIRAVIAGLGSGALILMSVSMLADTMAYDRILAKEGREGLLSSTIAVTEKVSFALGVAVLGYFLQMFDYVHTVDGALVEQPESAMFALEMGCALVPSLLFIINGMFLFF